MEKNQTTGQPAQTAEPTPPAIDWAAKVAELEAALTKSTSIAREAIKKRDDVKAAVSETSQKVQATTEINDHLKEQLHELQSHVERADERSRTAAVRVAATAKLSQMGVNPSLIDLAIRSLDPKLIEYDADTDTIDDTGLSTAVSKFKSAYPAMFESKIQTPGVRTPADTSGNDGNTISRSQWRNMTPLEQRAAIKAGKRIGS